MPYRLAIALCVCVVVFCQPTNVIIRHDSRKCKHFFQIFSNFFQKVFRSLKNLVISRFSRIHHLYCSICFPRNPAALDASLSSVSPIFCFSSRERKITDPTASPSLMMGQIVSEAIPSGPSCRTGTNRFSPAVAWSHSLSWIICSSSWLIAFPMHSFFPVPAAAIIVSLSATHTI